MSSQQIYNKIEYIINDTDRDLVKARIWRRCSLERQTSAQLVCSVARWSAPPERGLRGDRGRGGRTSVRCAGSSHRGARCASSGGDDRGPACLTTSAEAASSGHPPTTKSEHCYACKFLEINSRCLTTFWVRLISSNQIGAIEYEMDCAADTHNKTVRLRHSEIRLQNISHQIYIQSSIS